ncbi:elongation factor P maturation arginine rhamnosyltransferase EarP, partial [Xanthomonas citri pv. citri]
PDLPERQAAFDRAGWRERHGIAPGAFAVSLFCYEPAGLPALLGRLAERGDAHLLATPGRATAAVRSALQGGPAVPVPAFPITFLEPCPQTAFDEMLLACDLNAVRGEDSLVRALWAGQPFVWHIYPQDDGAH